MDPLSAPLKVSIDLTRECNLACAHCRCRAPGAQPTVSTALILRLLDEVAALRVFRISFSGGEPLLRCDAADILEYACRVAPGRVSLSTNGTLLRRDLLTRLRPWRDRFGIHVSVDGPHEVHDRFRGRQGALALTLDAMRAAAEEGFRVGATTTLTSVNHALTREIAETIADTGCDGWTVVEVLPVGAAGPELLLDAAQRAVALRDLESARDDMTRRSIELKVRLPFADGRKVRCLGGITECGVTASGDIVGCRLLPEISESNIAERPLGDVWSDPSSFAAFRGAGVPSGCSTCSVAATCRGGCKAISGGTAVKPARDPRCVAVR